MGATIATTESIGSLLDQEDVEPWAWFDQVRALGDVVWDEKANGWLVTSFDLLLQMSQDDIDVWCRPEQLTGDPEWSRYADRVPPGYSAERWAELIEQIKGHGRSMELSFLEGEEHAHQHRWWMGAMSPRTLERWRESKVRPLVREQVDELGARAELGRDLVEPLVPRIIAAVMGEPTDRAWVERHSRWSQQHTRARLVQFETDPDPQIIEDSAAAHVSLHETLLPIVAAKRDRDDDDLISLVWRDAERFFAPERFGPYDEDDVVSLAITMSHVGVNNVGPAVRNVLYLLLQETALAGRVRAGGVPAVRGLGEEALRLYGPVDIRPRVARHDTMLGDVEVKAGDMVFGLRVAANRDGEKFDHPTEVVLDRHSPANHFSFYKGRRTCPGQGLARMIIEETANVVLDRLPDLRADPDAESPRYTGLILRRWQPLHALTR